MALRRFLFYLSVNYVVRLTVHKNFEVIEEFFERDKFFGSLEILKYYSSILTGEELAAALNSGSLVNTQKEDAVKFDIQFTNNSHQTLKYYLVNDSQTQILILTCFRHVTQTTVARVGQVWLIENEEGTKIASYTPEANL